MSRKKTTEEFIEDAKFVHGDKYDYNISVYIDAKTKLKIMCRNHGIFEQSPNSHLRNHGCPKCASELTGDLKRHSNSRFIEKSKKIHGDKYDYSQVEYIGSNTKVNIICPVHGCFSQFPGNHLYGQGCPMCGIEKHSSKRRKSLSKFLNDSKEIHKNKYDYSLVNYKNTDTKVTIICPIHGEFNQTPSNHLNGKGCFKCGLLLTTKYQKKHTTGWGVSSWDKSAQRSKRFDSFKVYIIKCWNDTESFYKVGRTFLTVHIRFNSNKSMPYCYCVIEELIFETAKEAYDKETELKRLNKEFKYLPKIEFAGMQECFYKINLH